MKDEDAIKIYSYCSYEGSPCGFVLGSLVFQPEEEYKQTDCSIPARFILQNEDIPSIVQKILECGSVDFAFGNLPDPESYWIVVKELNAKDSKPYRYLNFAFMTNKQSIYLTLLSGLFQEYKDIPEMIRQFSGFITLQEENLEFGMAINSIELSEFWKKCELNKELIPKFFRENKRIYLLRKILSDEANKNRSKELEVALQLEKPYVIRHNARNHCHVIYPRVSEMLKTEARNILKTEDCNQADYGEDKNDKEGRL